LSTKNNLQLDQTMSFAFKDIMSLPKLASSGSQKPIWIPKYLVPFPLGIQFNPSP